MAGLDPVGMPITGAEWQAQNYQDGQYRPNDCLWNVAYNQAVAENCGSQEPSSADIQRRVDKIVTDYKIANPDSVSKEQLDRIVQDSYGKTVEAGYAAANADANRLSTTIPQGPTANGVPIPSAQASARAKIATQFVSDMAQPGSEKKAKGTLDSFAKTLFMNRTGTDGNTNWVDVGGDIATIANTNPEMAKQMAIRAFAAPNANRNEVANAIASKLTPEQLKALGPDVQAQVIMGQCTGKDGNTNWGDVGKKIAEVAKTDPQTASELASRAFSTPGANARELGVEVTKALTPEQLQKLPADIQAKVLMGNRTGKDGNTNWKDVGDDIAKIAKTNPQLASQLATQAFAAPKANKAELADHLVANGKDGGAGFTKEQLAGLAKSDPALFEQIKANVKGEDQAMTNSIQVS